MNDNNPTIPPLPEPDPLPRTPGTYATRCDLITGHTNNGYAITYYYPNGDRQAICPTCHTTLTFPKGQLKTYLEATDGYPYDSMNKQ